MTNAVPFDQNAIGDLLEVTVADTILQTNAIGASAHRCARSQFGQGSTTARVAVEFYAYSPTGDNPSLAPSAGVPPIVEGFVNASASLSKYVGEDADGWGYCRGDGNVYNNGSPVSGFGLPWATST